MRTVNRSAFIVRPKEGYLRWAASVDPEAHLAAGVLRDRVSVYLVPEDPKGEQETPPIADYFDFIFRYELGAWHRDESAWPKIRDLGTFHEWFHVVGESIVVDLADGKLRHEEYGD